ncbi:MAG: SPW repeat protein [Pseudomonadota bacterium]|jgi:hypothetical protein
MDAKRWQDWTNLVLGLWLFVSPWVLGFTDMAMPAWNAYLMGVAIMLFAALAIYSLKAREEWMNMVFGFWLMLSPWVLGFTAQNMPALNAVITGALVTALATWAMAQDLGFAKWWHDHHHPSA